MSGEKENVMRDLQVDKLIINISVGTSGDPLTKAAKVLKQLTSIDGSDGQQPVESKGAPPPARTPARDACSTRARGGTRSAARTGRGAARRDWQSAVSGAARGAPSSARPERALLTRRSARSALHGAHLLHSP